MNETIKPMAGRMRRPSWRDPRLLVGLLLIAVSVVAVSLLMRSADTTSPYYAAKHPLTPGTVLTQADVVVISARLAGDAYLAPGAEPWGQVVTRVVERGELMPRTALVSPADFDGRPVGLRTSVPLASNIVPGAVVDVYVTSVSAEGTPVTEVVGSALVVDDVVRDQARLGLAGSETVYVIVPTHQITAFLEALAGGGDISVVGYARQGS